MLACGFNTPTVYLHRGLESETTSEPAANEVPEVSLAQQEEARLAFEALAKILLTVKVVWSKPTNKSMSKGIIIEEYTGQSLDVSRPRVMLMLHLRHFYVIGIYRRILFMADGTNDVLTNKTLVSWVQRRIGLDELRLLSYPWQQAAGHCDSSAAVIMLEFLRFMGLRRVPEDIPDVIHAVPARQKKMLETFHSDEASDDREYADETDGLICLFCHKKFMRITSLKHHEGHCRQRRIASPDSK